MQSSFILIILALGLIGAGAVTLTPKSRKRRPLGQETVIKVREAVPDPAEPDDDHGTSLSENTPVEVNSQECRLGLNERTVLDEFLDPATSPERKEEIAELLREAGFEIRSRKKEARECAQANDTETPAGTVSPEEGTNAVSLKKDSVQDGPDGIPDTESMGNGNHVSMEPHAGSVNLDEFGVIDQNDEITAGLRS